MGFFGNLFRQQKVDVERLLISVARQGKGGIVQVPYDVLESYLRTRGSEHQYGSGAMECFTDLNGKRFRVIIDHSPLRHRNLRQGETAVSLSGGLDVPTTGPDETATLMKQKLSTFIKDSDTARAVSWQIINTAESDYMHGLWAQDQFDVTYESLRSPLLSIFTEREPSESKSDIDWHRFNDCLKESTIGIRDSEQKLKICHLVTEKIINEWNLIER